MCLGHKPLLDVASYASASDSCPTKSSPRWLWEIGPNATIITCRPDKPRSFTFTLRTLSSLLTLTSTHTCLSPAGSGTVRNIMHKQWVHKSVVTRVSEPSVLFPQLIAPHCVAFPPPFYYNDDEVSRIEIKSNRRNNIWHRVKIDV